MLKYKEEYRPSIERIRINYPIINLYKWLYKIIYIYRIYNKIVIILYTNLKYYR